PRGTTASPAPTATTTAATAAATAAAAAERLAAVAGAGDTDAQDPNDLVVTGVHANLAEVHRADVDAVDARPRFASVVAAVDAAVQVALRPLLVLDVLLLTEVLGAERPVGPAAATAAAATAPAAPTAGLAVGQSDFAGLALAFDRQPDGLPRLGGLDDVEQILVGLDVAVAGLLDDVVHAQAGLVRRP